MKRLILIISFLSLTSCEQMAINRANYKKEMETRKLMQEAEDDLITVRKYGNLPTCDWGYSPRNWNKIGFDDKSGYCILRPKNNKTQ